MCRGKKRNELLSMALRTLASLCHGSAIITDLTITCSTVLNWCKVASRLHQYFEGGPGAETRHALGEAEFAL
jgi:hypothetical protein